MLVFGALPAVLRPRLGWTRRIPQIPGCPRPEAQTPRASNPCHAAVEDTIAMLSYGPDNVESTLKAAEDRLTGPFLQTPTHHWSKTVVIPGAKQQKISTTATVPAAASSLDNPHPRRRHGLHQPSNHHRR